MLIPSTDILLTGAHDKVIEQLNLRKKVKFTQFSQETQDTRNVGEHYQ
jgi:hypothetical protein